jgi:carbon-monoxide dehydrogenase large subunit
MSGFVGQRVLRREDARFLRGAGRYVENLDVSEALHVTFVRSPVAHARVAGVDVSEARAAGAQAFTAADLDLGTFDPPPFPGLDQRMGRPFLAHEVVRFAGDIVAIVVTHTRAEGFDAAELVAVDYEELPAVADPHRALAGDVLLFTEAGTNVCRRGGPEQRDEGLFDGCDAVVSGRLVSQRLAPSPLEARSSAAAVGDDGRLTVWLSTQTPHQDRAGLARALGLDPSAVRVVAPDVGGGFGAKILSAEDVLVAWLARKLGRPVRWTETRSENMVAMTHGRAAVLDFTIGGSRDGRVQAYRLDVLQDVGAYPGIAAILPGFTGLMASGVYGIPKIEVGFTCVVTNTTPIGPFRGAGRPEATQAVERGIDLFAAEVGLDPAEVRRRNFIQPDAFPYTTASGAGYDSGDYERALDLALDAAGYAALREEQRRRRAEGGVRQLGIGVSAYVEITNGLPEGEFGAVEITADGEAVLRTGSFSHGQGHETTFAMIVADRLGIPLQSVRVVKGDTDEVLRGTGTYGSKSTQIGGVAAGLAADDVVERAKSLAADLLEASAADVVLDVDAGAFHVVGAPRPSLSWAELASRLEERGQLGELRAEHDFAPGVPTFPFGAHVAVVEVDTETGAVELRRLVAVDDAGRIINPVIAQGQVHGGVATGVAQALYEEVVYDDDGNPLTASLLAYAFPSAAELPSFDDVPMETPTPINPLGAKGIGESGTIGATPAVQNAVADALAPLGVRHVDMPANGERVWRALRDAGFAGALDG